jgi:putative transcriptional regulator
VPTPRPGTVRIYDFSMLKSFRIRQGLSQQELADAVGACRSTIYRLEKRKALPSVTLAVALARRLEATVEELFAPDDLR